MLIVSISVSSAGTCCGPSKFAAGKSSVEVSPVLSFRMVSFVAENPSMLSQASEEEHFSVRWYLKFADDGQNSQLATCFYHIPVLE